MTRTRVPARQPNKQVIVSHYREETLVRRVFALAMALLPISTAAADAQVSPEQARCEQVTSIGVATMAADGTITMQLRSLPPGPVAEGILVYRPDDARYAEILRHLDGLVPGESKPVPPWC